MACYKQDIKREKVKKKALYKAKQAKNKAKRKEYIIGVLVYKEKTRSKKAKKELERQSKRRSK